MKILIADDDPVSSRLLDRLLVKWGYEVIAAHDGSEAWEVLQAENAPRVALLDWIMPGIDGLEICRRVRASIERNSTKLGSVLGLQHDIV